MAPGILALGVRNGLGLNCVLSKCFPNLLWAWPFHRNHLFGCSHITPGETGLFVSFMVTLRSWGRVTLHGLRKLELGLLALPWALTLLQAFQDRTVCGAKSAHGPATLRHDWTPYRARETARWTERVPRGLVTPFRP